jgi:hypothetical protein
MSEMRLRGFAKFAIDSLYTPNQQQELTKPTRHARNGGRWSSSSSSSRAVQLDIALETKMPIPTTLDFNRMKIAAAAFLFLAAVHCASAHWLDDAAARSNSLQTTWRAAVSPRFQNVSRPVVVSMMGVPMQEHEKSLVSLPKSSSSPLSSALPAAFDVYEQWPQCTATIADQGIYRNKMVVNMTIGCGALLADQRRCRPMRLLLGFRYRRLVC